MPINCRRSRCRLLLLLPVLQLLLLFVDDDVIIVTILLFLLNAVCKFVCVSECVVIISAATAIAVVTASTAVYCSLHAVAATIFPFDTCFEVSRAPSSHFTFIFRLTIAYRFSFLLFHLFFVLLSFVFYSFCFGFSFSFTLIRFLCTLSLPLINCYRLNYHSHFRVGKMKCVRTLFLCFLCGAN